MADVRNPFRGGYGEYAKTDGIGRNVLEARLREATKEMQRLFDNVTSCQIDNTRLVEERRLFAVALTLLKEVGALECVGEPACGDCVRCRAKALITT